MDRSIFNLRVTDNWIMLAVLAFLFTPIPASGQSATREVHQFREVARYEAQEAVQGVAVDDRYFYAIANRAIGKYDKATGKRVGGWTQPTGGPLIHLDSGAIIDHLLYCAHSNYPGDPMTSSVEIWSTTLLEHAGTHSFGIEWGSLTWLDRFAGYWWGVFANYNQVMGHSHRAYGNSYRTSLVKFGDSWRRLESWVFPDTVVRRVLPMSISGGSWGPDSLLYCTGHDRKEVYILKPPDAGSILQLIERVPLPAPGQGIAWDRSTQGVLYGIDRSRRQVIVMEMSKETR